MESDRAGNVPEELLLIATFLSRKREFLKGKTRLFTNAAQAYGKAGDEV